MAMIAQPKHILVMTATITPGNSPSLARTNPLDRLNDYQKSLSYYLNFIDDPLFGVVFVENSDSDVSSLQRVVDQQGHGSRVEFIANYGSYMYSEQGRAYGELKLLDYAMARSKMLHRAGTEAIVWKTTGRYVVKNLQAMITRAPKRFDVYCDMKNYPMRWMDMRFLAWTTKGYDLILRGLADELGSTAYEPVMREIIPSRAKDALLVQRFANEPLIDGIRGWDNQNYAKGKNLLKFYARSMGRVVAPWYWF